MCVFPILRHKYHNQRWSNRTKTGWPLKPSVPIPPVRGQAVSPQQIFAIFPQTTCWKKTWFPQKQGCHKSGSAEPMHRQQIILNNCMVLKKYTMQPCNLHCNPKNIPCNHFQWQSQDSSKAAIHDSSRAACSAASDLLPIAISNSARWKFS